MTKPPQERMLWFNESDLDSMEDAEEREKSCKAREVDWTRKFMDGKRKPTPPRRSARVRQRHMGEARGTTDAAPAQDTSGPGEATASALPAPQVPVVDTATHEATTQEDEPEASGSESDDGSDDNETLDKFMGVVNNVMKELDSMKKKKKKGKKTKKKGDKKRRK